MHSANGDATGARLGAVARASAHAPFLADLIARQPALVTAFVDDGFDAALAMSAPWPAPGDDVVVGLRRRRSDMALLVALADLSGCHDLYTTIGLLSDFADRACDIALEAAYAERAPGEPVQGLAIIALGKLGSRELNYSSDIDPILIYDPATVPRRARDDPAEAATRLARRWVEILSARTGDGYVMRVDLRLRPSPEVTPIALPVDAAISYYESQALAWEQAAFIRARASAGDTALGTVFLSAIKPFIWRSIRDFGQLDRIADMSKRIRDHYHGGQRFGPGYDLKRGAGGIREIEFFAQSQQLIHGGRNPDLRIAPLPLAYRALAKAGIVDPAVAEQMIGHNAMLRTFEHRLQMVDDQQTHSLPVSGTALDNVARLHGLADGAAMLAVLAPVIADIGAAFDQLLPARVDEAAWPQEPQALAAAIDAAGFPGVDDAMRRITEWRSGRSRALRSTAARDALERLLPAVFAALSATPDPVAALSRLDALISGLPSAINFFHLLAARPQLLASLVAILAHAPTLAAQLGTRAELIEGLIDATAFQALPSPDELTTRLRGASAALSYEELLDRVRREVGELRFALGAQLIEGAADPIMIARSYADVAEAALTVLTAATIDQFAARHGRVPGGELLILALGRLGGQSLTHASDLDVIILFSGDHLAESDGERPLGATTYFNRLAQRVVAALSVPTAAGPLYDVDTRLRPQGVQGPLAASMDAFARYQRDDAWTWEHLALTRARPVYGSSALRSALSAIVTDTLTRPRDTPRLQADVRSMRADIAQHKPAKGPLDVKMMAGGLVDIEFGVHFLQLSTGVGLYPQLDAALTALADAGHVPQNVADAHALFTRILVCARLMLPDLTTGDLPAQHRIAIACGMDDWATLDMTLQSARLAVTAWFTALGLAS